MKGHEKPEKIFELVGGALCLDFANTVSSYFVPVEERPENLSDYAALLSWSRQAGALDAATIARLERAAARHPAQSARVVRDAHELRAAIFAGFSAVAAGERADPDTLATLSRFYAATHERQRLVARQGGYTLECACDDDALGQMLWPVARSAIELFTSDRRERVHCCEGAARKTCTWLFVDESKNHSRRWCSMRDCGNRAKVRRHYERNKRDAS